MSNLILDKKIKKIHDLITIRDGCWLWNGRKNEKGYGYFSIGGKNVRIHRFYYEYFTGRSVKGLELDHLCRNRNCINPNHLEIVSHTENMRRAMRTHCPKGHPYLGKNLIRRIEKNGWIKTTCRICQNKANVEYRKRIKLKHDLK